MATLTLKIDKGNVNTFVKDTKERFESNPLTNLLINANICIFKDKEGELIIFHLRPMVSSFLLIFPAIIFGVAIFLFSINPYLYFIPGIYISIILAFYSDYFLYLIYLWGLKKAKIKAKATRVNRDELIRRMVSNYESNKPKDRAIQGKHY
jgi:hypothetical protein